MRKGRPRGSPGSPPGHQLGTALLVDARISCAVSINFAYIRNVFGPSPKSEGSRDPPLDAPRENLRKRYLPLQERSKKSLMEPASQNIKPADIVSLTPSVEPLVHGGLLGLLTGPSADFGPGPLLT